MSEVRLNAAKVARQCACRGWIVGTEAPAADNAEAVTKHQAEEPHKSWDREAWIEANTAKVPVPSASLRRVA